MKNWVAYAMVASTVLLTVAGQFIVKWQVLRAGDLPAGTHGQMKFVLQLVTNPWIVSAFLAAAIAAVTWMLAMTKLELSHAYPFMASTFVLVLAGSAWLFNEQVTLPKVVGLLLIVAGIWVGSQG